MTIQLSLVSFSPNTTIKSADVNANFQQILNASKFYGDHGAVNNTNVYVTFEDITIYVLNKGKSVSCARHRVSNSSIDRSLCFTVKVGNNTYTGLVIDEGGHCHFKYGHPRDRYGNHCGSHCYFSGNGSGYYNHGFNGRAPLTITVTINDSNGPVNVCIDSITSSNVHVNMSSARNFDGMCHHYDDDGDNDN